MSWTMIKNFRGGHSFWLDKQNRVVIADESGDGPGGHIGRPDQTDDGPLYLVPGGGRVCGEWFDIMRPDGTMSHTPAGEEELAYLVVNHGYEYAAPAGVQRMIKRQMRKKKIGHDHDLSPRDQTPHSPEFWSIEGRDTDIGDWRIVDMAGNTVAHTHHVGFTCEQEANAVLMAAAPKLKRFVQIVGSRRSTIGAGLRWIGWP